jgi:hypothetical protein
VDETRDRVTTYPLLGVGEAPGGAEVRDTCGVSLALGGGDASGGADAGGPSGVRPPLGGPAVHPSSTVTATTATSDLGRTRLQPRAARQAQRPRSGRVRLPDELGGPSLIIGVASTEVFLLSDGGTGTLCPFRASAMSAKDMVGCFSSMVRTLVRQP